MIKEFIENPKTQELHAKGIEQVTIDGNLESGSATLINALAVLKQESRRLTYSRLMQEARITRDLGFVPVRQAAELVAVVDENVCFPAEPKHYLEEAYDQLDSSRRGTALIAQLGPLGFSPDAWKFLESEHGFTVGLIGRCVTLSEVLGISLTKKTSRATYRVAWDHLKTGSNHAYAADIAIKAARSSIFHGRHEEAYTWKDVCADSVTLAEQSGNQEMHKEADKTFREGIPSLISKQAAMLSILQNP